MGIIESIAGLVFLAVIVVLSLVWLVGTFKTRTNIFDDRDELIKRVDDPYKTDYWNQQ